MDTHSTTLGRFRRFPQVQFYFGKSCGEHEACCSFKNPKKCRFFYFSKNSGKNPKKIKEISLLKCQFWGDTQKSKSWKVRQSKANRSLWPPLFPDLNFLLLWGQTGKKVALRLFFLAMPFKAFTYIFKTKKGDPLWSSIRFLDQTPFSTPIFGAWLFWGVIEGSELLLWVVRFQPLKLYTILGLTLNERLCFAN